MPEVEFTTKNAIEVLNAQQALNKAAEEGAKAYDELGGAAQEAGKDILTQAKKGDEAQDKLTKGVKQTREEMKKNLAEQQRIGRMAEQITKRNETAQERYNRILKDTQSALKAGAISADLYEREMRSINAEMAKSEGRFKSFATQQEQSFGAKAVQQLVSYGAGLVSIGAGVQLITAELRAQQDIVDRAQAAKTTVSESRNVLLRNLVGESPETIKAMLAEDTALAKQLNISESVINMARAEAFSATGGDRKASFDAVKTSAQFLKDRPGDIAGFTGTLTDLSIATGSNDSLVNLGYLSTIGKLSRVTDPRAQATNLAPAIINQLAYGSTPQEAAALTATLTAAAADSQGATSGTGSIALAQQAREFFGGAGGTTGQRIAALQADPARAREFLADASFEKKVGGAIEQLLLDPNSKAARAFAANMAALPDEAGLRRAGIGAIDSLKFNSLNAPVDLERAIASASERAGLTVTNGRLTSESVSQLKALTTRATDSVTASVMYGAAAAGGVTPSEAITILEANRVRAEQSGEINRKILNNPFGIGDKGVAQERITESKAVVTALDEMISILRKQATDTEQIRQNTEDGGLIGVAQ